MKEWRRRRRRRKIVGRINGLIVDGILRNKAGKMEREEFRYLITYRCSRKFLDFVEHFVSPAGQLAGKNFTIYVGPPPNEITSCRVTWDTRSTQANTKVTEKRGNFEKSTSFLIENALYRCIYHLCLSVSSFFFFVEL